MADEKRKDPFVAVSTAVIVLAALGVTFLKVPLQTLRPAQELREPAEPERVRSRLWQDPFTTVLEYIQSQSKTPASSDAKKSDKSLEAIWPCRLEHNDGKLDLLRHLKNDVVQKKLFAADDPLLKQLYNYLYDRKEKVTVLAVMMPGSPYAEDIEARIRERVAVLSALGRLGYVPEDAEHLNFFRIQIKDACQEPRLLSDFIPYEWLQKPSHGHTRKVLVLWLNEDLFQNHPLFNISKFNEYIHLIDFLVPEQNTPLTLPMKVIGPASSGILGEMIDEVAKHPATRVSLEIYSPAATAPNYWLLPGLVIQRDTNPTLEKIKGEIKKFSEQKGSICLDERADILKLDQHLGKAFGKAFQDKGITFHRTTLTDAELADTLVTELENRQVNLLRQKQWYHEWLPGWLWKHDHKDKAVPPGGHSDHVVLISEWDTLYGRALPETFLRMVRQRHNQGLEPGDSAYLRDTDTIDWVHRYSYLRGLDGITHSAKDKKESRSRDGGDKDSKDKEKLGLEEPVGSSQYDYLRRLADKIYLKHQQLLQSGQGGIRAVGILGNDFYDKYLVLQALKQRLPEAVYFTTDLDARFLHESYQKYTRNLVVASSFALELPPDIQGAVPPFRTSYQTAAFYSVLRALGDLEVESVDEHLQKFYEDLKKVEPSQQPNNPGSSEAGIAGKSKDKSGPSLFEIGSQHAIALHESPESHWSQWKVLAMGLFLVLLLIFLSLLSPFFRDWLTHGYSFWLVLLGSMLSLVLYWLVIFPSPKEEPLRFFEGVSIWPTEILRLLALACSWAFYGHARQSLEQNTQDIGERFNLSKIPGFSCRSGFLASFLDRRSCTKEHQEEVGRFYVPDLWKDYLCQAKYQWRRVLLVTSIFFALGLCIMGVFGRPHPPVRGAWSWWLDRLILFTTIFSYLFLTFFVLDTTRLLRRFLKGTGLRQPVWDTDSKTTFMELAKLEEGREKPQSQDNHPKDSNPEVLKGEDLDYWLFIRLITRRTEEVNRLIFYPMIVWVILFAAIQPYFDNWSLTPGLLVVISASALVSWLCALLLNRTAEKWRVKVLERLQREKIRLQSTPAANDEQQKRVDSIINEIKNLREGAFLPFFQHPVVQAFLVPFTGVGGLTLLEYVVKLP